MKMKHLPWCRVCGCTETLACPGGCGWAPGKGNLCTVCAHWLGEIDKAVVSWEQAVRTPTMLDSLLSEVEVSARGRSGGGRKPPPVDAGGRTDSQRKVLTWLQRYDGWFRPGQIVSSDSLRMDFTPASVGRALGELMKKGLVVRRSGDRGNGTTCYEYSVVRKSAAVGSGGSTGGGKSARTRAQTPATPPHPTRTPQKRRGI
jgi:hypothetical protein